MYKDASIIITNINIIKNVETALLRRSNIVALRGEKVRQRSQNALDYTTVVWATIIFIESHIHTQIQYSAMAEEIGFSLSHLRAVFMKLTGKSLALYILERKISRAAFDIIHSGDTLAEIAGRYGFTNPDTFTRAFRRVTGLTPSEFRKIKPPIERTILCAGVFGFAVPKYSQRI